MPIRNILYLLIQILDVAPAHEHLGGVAVVVVEEDAAARFECLDLLHVLCAQREVVEHQVEAPSEVPLSFYGRCLRPPKVP